MHQEIRALIQGSAFTGEGHRKVWAKLRQLRGVYTSRKRVLRVMREHEH
ncbi:IS3 family transposase [Halorhodospira halochloris]